MVNKYHNKKTNGYDSKKENRRAGELKLLERAGEITDLKEQVKFVLIPNQGKDYRECSYYADFTYKNKSGSLIVEDVKSKVTKTSEYIIKKKLMKQVYGIEIIEV